MTDIVTQAYTFTNNFGGETIRAIFKTQTGELRDYIGVVGTQRTGSQVNNGIVPLNRKDGNKSFAIHRLLAYNVLYS